MPSLRDSQRSRVTRAMWAESNAKCTRAEAIGIAAKLLHSKWFTRNFVPVLGRNAFSTFRWTKSKRALAYALAWHFRERVHTSKSAWAYHRGAPHGREFCHMLLRFVEKLEGKAAAAAVRAAFKTYNVRYTKPRERRTLPPLERAAMIARLDGARAKRARTAGVGEISPAVETCLQCGKPYIPADPFTSHDPSCKWFGVE